MEICVDNEVGSLRAVLVHRPGDEILRMTQHQLDALLFDDILSPAETVREHDLLVEILREGGAEVFEISTLLEDALGRAPADATAALLERVAEQASARWLAPVLGAMPREALARALVRGIYASELEHPPASLASIRAALFEPDSMVLPPLPNLMFMRDPCISIFDRFVVGRMATSARQREPLLVSFAVRFGHDAGAATPGSGRAGAGGRGRPLLFDEPDFHRSRPYRQLEGGDLLVLSRRAIAVGCSQRTSAGTIERLAEEALFPAFPALERIFVVMMPEARSVMHLDTILTQVDRDLFLGHRPLVAGQGARAPLVVAVLERGRTAAVAGGSTLDILRAELGSTIELASCGGDDPLHQEREQWTDGANAVCVSPGHIILYARNVQTIRTLVERHAFEEVRLSVVLPPEQRREIIQDAMRRPRIVFSVSGSELSRARGGARCLTMPLRRAPAGEP